MAVDFCFCCNILKDSVMISRIVDSKFEFCISDDEAANVMQKELCKFKPFFLVECAHTSIASWRDSLLLFY